MKAWTSIFPIAKGEEKMADCIEEPHDKIVLLANLKNHVFYLLPSNDITIFVLVCHTKTLTTTTTTTTAKQSSKHL